MKDWLLPLLCVFAPGLSALPALPDLEPESFGWRAGLGTENGDDIFGAEAMAYFDDILEWEPTDAIELELATEASFGLLSGHGDEAALIHFGFAGFLEFGESPLSLIVSTGPTLLSGHRFETFDLGGPIQFTSAIGLDLEWVDDWTMGYRYQHISNAGLYRKNPGLNMHVLALAHDF